MERIGRLDSAGLRPCEEADFFRILLMVGGVSSIGGGVRTRRVVAAEVWVATEDMFVTGVAVIVVVLARVELVGREEETGGVITSCEVDVFSRNIEEATEEGFVEGGVIVERKEILLPSKSWATCCRRASRWSCPSRSLSIRWRSLLVLG